MKIMVIGGGGVGGYITAYLDKYCPGEVTLAERGKHKEYMEAHGISVYSEALGDRLVKVPVTDQPARAGVQDIIFICVKADSLEEALKNIAPAVDDGTILVPLMSGAEHERWIRRTLDKGIIVEENPDKAAFAALSGPVYDIFIKQVGTDKYFNMVRDFVAGLRK